MVIVNKKQSAAIAAINKMGRRLEGLDYSIHIWFQKHKARMWKDNGCEGYRAACWDLMQELSHVPGAYDLYREALKWSYVRSWEI
jgi:hypothetical protein